MYNGKTLLTAITAFVHILLDGHSHNDFSHILFGGKLIALIQKTGGVRQVVTGYILRSLAAKYAARYACMKLQDFLSPRQAGIGVSGSCEAIVHATRRFIDNMTADDVVVKLDISNAFNSLHRAYMLSCVAERIAEIYKFCSSSYDVDSTLQFGEFMILSLVGPQNGDPLSGRSTTG